MLLNGCFGVKALTSNNLKDYTKPLLKERLDLLTRSVHGNERLASEEGKLLKTAGDC